MKLAVKDLAELVQELGTVRSKGTARHHDIAFIANDIPVSEEACRTSIAISVMTANKCYLGKA
jgi:hypothetical protein